MRWPWKAETELDREIQHHLETLTDAFERQGIPREEATRRARAEFGGVDRAKEECRDVRWWNWLAQLRQDLRFGGRMIRKTPAITAAAALSLALGIGATTAMLSLADALLWRKLAAPEPEQLGEIFWESGTRQDGLINSSSGSNFRDGALSVADFFSQAGFDAMRDRTDGKAQVAGHVHTGTVSSSFRGVVAVAKLRAVTGNFFSMLELRPFTGRLLTDTDDDPAAVPVVVTTHHFWVRRLGGDVGVVGRPMRINNTLYSIAGVLPPDFHGIAPGDETELYAPIRKSPQFLKADSWLRAQAADPTSWWLQLMVRRAPGVAEDELRSALDAAFASSWAVQPTSPEATPRIRLTNASRGLGEIRRELGDPVWILLGLTTLVLLVVCANIANLMLARAVAREKEVALRVSLGCGNGRLVRQFLTESLMLAAIGGVMSIPIAALLGNLMVGLLSSGYFGMELSLEPDIRSLAGTAALTFLTAVVFGLYPAWRAVRINPTPALKEGTGTAGTTSRKRWLPAKVLVLVQVSLGVLLVTAAILFTSRLNEMVSREAGFERGHVLLFDVRPGEVGYEGGALLRFYVELEERLGDLTGVDAVGLARTRPMRGGGYWDRLRTPGSPDKVRSAIHHGNASFLESLGVPIAAGRAMTAQEARTGASVAVISENLARELGAASPLGMLVSGHGDAEYEVIGVARQARYSDMTREPPVAYLPFDYGLRSATVVVRTSFPPLAAFGAVSDALRAVDPNLPLVDVYTMEQQISRTLLRERLFAWLCGGFGILALVLCTVGIYGLMSHTTARRTSEMGIRIALGASRRDVMAQVLREAMSLAGIGLALGVPLALYGAYLGEALKLLPEGPAPYGTLVAAIGVLAASALLAVLAPAVRASSVDPMLALRRG